MTNVFINYGEQPRAQCRCMRCKGNGVVLDPNDIYRIARITCPACRGTGVQ